MNETQQVTRTVPKVTYESQYVLVPKTIQEPKVVKEKAIRYVNKEVWDTKIVAIQVRFRFIVDFLTSVINNNGVSFRFRKP